MERLIVARHAHAVSNVADVVSCRPPGEGLSERGVEEALALREAIAGERIELAVASELVRTQETLALALGERDVPRLVLREWNEIDFGSFEARPLSEYRDWAWTHEADVPCPGGGESRGAAALRIATALDTILRRAERTILAVGHALPVRYVLDAADGRFPQARIAPVQHAVPHVLTAAGVAAAASALRRWGAAPAFAGTPQASCRGCRY
jgi:probable phosphoglycerate mutase